MWGGQAVSQLGSQVTLLAMPLAAATILGAGAIEMGVLAALGRAPYLLLALVAGVWVDRWSRRRILILANLGLALTLGVVPVTAALGWLSMTALYVVTFVAGALTVFLEIAYLSYVPALVERAHLTRAQGALETSQSLAQLGGPGLGGLLVQVLTAPLAIAADAISFVLSAGTLLVIRAQEPPRPDAGRPAVAAQIGEGLRLVFGQAVLRAVTLCTTTFILWFSAFSAVFVLFLVRDLSLSPGVMGLVFGCGALGGLLGGLVAPRLGRALGLGRVLTWSIVVAAAGGVLAPLASGSRWAQTVWVCASMAVLWFGQQAYNVHQVPVRYALTPDPAHGRVNATIRFVVWGAAPLGSLLGGLLGAYAGLRPGLLICAAASALGSAWIILSPVRTLRDL